MKFDPTKPVQTRDGRPARIICTDMKDPNYPIVALISYENREIAHSYRPNGRFPVKYEDELDLINIPRKIVRYVNVYLDGLRDFPDRKAADNFQCYADRIACVRVEFQEGQFDD